MQNSPPVTKPFWPALTGLVFLLAGAGLTWGGIRLGTLGGSWYYAITGIAFLLTGVLSILRRPATLWLYALVLLGTVVWALLEVGFDFWSLEPRLFVPFLLGLWLLAPWVRRNLGAACRSLPALR